MRDQFLLGLREGPVRQSLRVQLRRDPELTFEDLRREALALESDYAETADSSVCMAASGRSDSTSSGLSDWKQTLRAELMKDVREQMTELSKTLLEEFRREQSDPLPMPRELSYSDGGRNPGRRPFRPAGPRFQSNWVDSLPALVQAYNNSVHSTTGYAPTYLMFGRHVRLPTDLLFGTAVVEEASSLTDWVDRHHQRLHSAYERVTDRINVAAAKNKWLYDRMAREALLLPGERVLVRDNRRQGKGKLSDRWEALPYVVQCQQNPDQPVYTIRPEGKPGPEQVVHRNLIRPCLNYPKPTVEAPTVSGAPRPPLVGWAVVPRGPNIEPREVEPATPPRRSQRGNRGQPPERYGDWVSEPRSRN